MERRNNQISRRGLLTRGLVGLAGAAAVGRLPAKGQEVADRDLPREGSYVDGRKVVYIDGSRTELSEKGIHYLLMEPVFRSSGSGFILSGEGSLLDLGGYEIRGEQGCRENYESGAHIVANNACVKNGKNEGFYFGVYSRGAASKIDSLVVSGNDYGIGLEGGDKHVLSDLVASDNFIEGIHLEPSSRCRVKNFVAEENGEVDVGIFGEGNLFEKGIFKSFYSGYHSNVFRECDFENVSDQPFTKQGYYQAQVVDVGGNPIGNALVQMESNAGDLEVALRSDYVDGRTLKHPVTFSMNRLNPFNGAVMRTDFLPYLVTTEGGGFPNKRHIWSGDSEEDKIVLSD